MNKTFLLLSLAFIHFSFTPFVSEQAERRSRTELGAGQLPLTVAQLMTDTLPPLKDRYGDFINDGGQNPVDLKDPASIDKTVEYDPETGLYIVRERMGAINFRPPTYLTFDEYLEYRRQEDQKAYFNKLAGVGTGEAIDVEDPLANIDVSESLLNRLFGSNEISIQPQGGVDLTFGFNYQNQENPFFTERQRRTTIFDFDMDIQMNVVGQIGDKLKLNTNYNTGATFNFDNQIKLDYNSEAFGEDDILKKIEAGNVSLPLRGSLIEGAQSLFGLKTELQFGHLRLTAIASQQQSQREKLTIEGGAQLSEFEVYADSYDENRHFFLSHYNRDNYEEALARLPQINSLFNLENIEVWITNDRNEVLNVRDIVAFADLAEPERLTNPNAVNPLPEQYYREICDGEPLPENGANDLYRRLVARGEPLREIDRTVSILQSSEFNLQQIRDFEKVSARKLNPREYTVNQQLGYVSLNINVQPDQVVAVSYRYKYNGQVFKVGELSVNTDNVSADTSDLSNRVLYTKMLKSSSQRVGEPGWDLMMKNVYSLGAYQVNEDDFRLDIQYEDPGEGFKRFLPTSPLAGRPLIRVLGLDRLNTQNDPQPDGIFDFVPGVTFNPQTGRVYFPVLEPFGSDLAETILAAGGTQEDVNQYIYPQLYDSTLFRAREFPENNRFAIRGTYKSSVQSEISLGAFNIPPGSVRVTAGGALLVEGRDYSVDYSTGRVRVLNDAILSSGVPINVSFEDNTVFSLQSKTMLGLRADYEFNENLSVGATFLQLFERPFTQKVNLGEDPINNKIYGFDATFNKESGFITRMVDKLPFYSTSTPSSISLTAETAILKPGHSRAINQSRSEDGGIVYLDDFEGTASPIDLMVPVQRWFLASVPQNDGENNNPLFPEAREEGLVSGANRANISWYRIDQAARNGADNQNIYTNRVPQREIFPNRDIPLAQQQRFPFFTFDINYEPNVRGPYNFDPPSGFPGFTAGAIVDVGDTLRPVKLADPETRWGGIMREMTTNDFQSANIEFVEFWMLSPFLDPTDGFSSASDAPRKEGTLYLNLGNVSEDILKDSRLFFENGLPGPANPRRPVDETVWGRVPVAQQINRGFDNDPATREAQDVGLDGLNDNREADFFSEYVMAIENENANVANIVRRDPANDNFYYYNDERYGDNATLLTRYGAFNRPQGNSRNNGGGQILRQSSTNLPDSEDLNQDNTLNESESYFQYEIPLAQDPMNPREIDRSVTPFITDRIEDVGTDSGNTGRIWYRFRVPINTPDKTAVGGIQDFRSIRFMRMYMRGFETQTTLRFGKLELVRNSWRRYTRDFVDADTPPIISGDDDTEFSVDAVNIEENSRRNPFAYTLPNGIIREQSLGVVNTLQNEQSLSLRVDRLNPSDRRAVFKYTDTDLRLYERLKMFVHAEGRGDEFLQPEDGELSVFIRLGSDFTGNYYEYEVPLTISDTTAVLGLNPNTRQYKDEVWREENEIDFPLALLREIKQRRNELDLGIQDEYVETYVPDGREDVLHTIRVKGNPNLGYVKVFMIGIKNRNGFNSNAVSAEVWLNELRLEGLDERGGVAAIGRADIQLADLGNLTGAINYSSIGFGALDNSVTERSREQTVGYDLAANLQMDKFLPEGLGLRLPLYLQYSNVTNTPEYDPYDYDIKLADKLDRIDNSAERDSVREQAQEITKITAVNLTNVGISPQGGNGKPAPWDISNFSASYGITKTEHSDPFISKEEIRETTAALDYTYSRGKGGSLEPFKGVEGKYLRLIKEFNINPLPNSFSVTNLFNRRFAETNYRFADVDPRFNRYFNKRFTWQRNYDLQWNLTRSLRLNFNALMSTTIDEPEETRILEDNGIEDVDKYRRDSIWSNLRNFGRPKLYTHSFNASYTLPLRFLPFLDFVDVRANYQGGYTWNAAPDDDDEYLKLGNIIQNNQSRQVTADLNFEKFYDQFNFLRDINRPQRTNRRPTNTRSNDKDKEGEDAEDEKPKRKKRNQGASPLARALIRPLMALRRARLSYSEDFETVVPGYDPTPELLGLSNGWTDPGTSFILGLQPTIRTLTDAQRAAANNGNPSGEDWLAQNNGFLTTSAFLNTSVIQNYTKTWDAQVTVEPISDFRIELNVNRSFSENYTETYKVLEKPDPNDPNPVFNFNHAVPTYDGALTMTYGGLNSLLSTSDTASLTRLFSQFEANRVVISRRLGGSRPHADPELAERGYSFGYGPGQQEVLLPAFLAAYREEDANNSTLDPFSLTPSPNWRVTYNGLNKIGGLRDVFSRINITHGFQSTFSISSYGTSLDYLDALEQQQQDASLETGYDTVSLNYFPRIEIPNISEQKGFAPLIGIEAELTNGFSFNFTYQQAANRSLNIISKLLSENTTKEVIGGFGLVLQDVEIGFLTGNGRKKRRRGRNQEQDAATSSALSGSNNGRSRSGGRLNVADMDIQFNISLRDNITYASKPDQGIREATEGSQVLTFSPSAEYQVNQQLSLRAFFDYRKSKPYNSLGFPQTTASGGVVVRFQLN